MCVRVRVALCRVPVGHYLCKPHEGGDYVYIITKGHAKLLWAVDGMGTSLLPLPGCDDVWGRVALCGIVRRALVCVRR